MDMQSGTAMSVIASAIVSGIGTGREEMIAVMARNMRRKESHAEKRGGGTDKVQGTTASRTGSVTCDRTRSVRARVHGRDHDHQTVGIRATMSEDRNLSDIQGIMGDIQMASQGTRMSTGAEARREMGGESRPGVLAGPCLLRRGYGKMTARLSMIEICSSAHTIHLAYSIVLCLQPDVCLTLNSECCLWPRHH